MLWQPLSQLNVSVSLGKSIYSSLARVLSGGAFYKIRSKSGNLNQINPVKLFNRNPRSNLQVAKDEAIIVVGIGIAAFSLVKFLSRLGYTQIKIVARDDAFGGKCVNFGCMPSEYYAAYRDRIADDFMVKGQEFISSLRSITAQSFKELGYPVIKGEVSQVVGKKVYLNTGEKLEFDRLVLATGNKQPTSAWSEYSCSLQDFWQITEGKLVIVSNGNVSSLSYADLAADRGIETTVVFESPPLLAHLPSYKYFKRELEKRGIKIISSAKIEVGSDRNLIITQKNKPPESIIFDRLLYDGVPELNLPQIDGKTKTVLDLDFKQGNIIGRPDLSVLGDAAGFLSATEAELQAKKLANAWDKGTEINIADFERLPLRVHARKSLALVGSPWTLAYGNWQAVDFKALGWSAIHQEGGKLWYLYNSKQQKIEAIHICHRDASELISLASMLIDLPVNDSRWLTSSIHPSAAEIFKVAIENIEANLHPGKNTASLLEADLPKPQQATKKNAAKNNVLQLPPISELHRSSFYQAAFSAEERSRGILDRNPSLYFALLLGIKSLDASNKERTVILTSQAGDYLARGIDFSYQVESESDLVIVSGRSQRVLVHY